jgi:hypothetical protein
MMAAAGGFVWVVWVLVERSVDPGFVITRQLAISFVACATFWSYAILKYEYWRCPRCRHSFQIASIVGFWTIWPRKQCVNCGLPVGA